MSKSETKFSSYFKLPNPKLRSYFGLVRSGQPDEYRTTFYKGKSVEQVLKGWDRTLSKIKREWPSLYSFEIDLRGKVGPMSIMRPLSERMPDIDAYYDLISLKSKPISTEAILAALKEWDAARGLQIRSQEVTVNNMKKSSNSGSPYWDKRRTVTHKTVPCVVMQDGKYTTQFLPSSQYEACAVLGWRGQEGGPKPEDVKQRVVWMFPYAVNVAELQVYQPLIEAAQRFNIVPAWVGMEAVDAEITHMFDTKGSKDVVICTDFSKFDQHFNPNCQEAARDMIAHLFTPGVATNNWLDLVFPIKYNIPLAYDWGKVRYGRHGMGSGSGGTNADETLVHRALQHEAALSHGHRLNPHSQCLGDDGILTYPGITVDDVLQTYTSHGLEMNPDKQYVSTQDCVYLRRWHHQNYRVDGVCVGVYSTYRALGRLLEQERFYEPSEWGPKMVALRQLSILENCKYHPLREEFVNYCMKGDKFRLGLDIPGFLDNIESEAKKAIDHMPDFMGYTKSLGSEAGSAHGIADWWIIHYLKSKR